MRPDFNYAAQTI
ncbi:Protein of unknown function [Leuconostoc citreum LBAE E16]|nr:Protein of unknown function [Leuconostoc citreum LBAE E16]